MEASQREESVEGERRREENLFFDSPDICSDRSRSKLKLGCKSSIHVSNLHRRDKLLGFSPM